MYLKALQKICIQNICVNTLTTIRIRFDMSTNNSIFFSHSVHSSVTLLAAHNQNRIFSNTFILYIKNVLAFK